MVGLEPTACALRVRCSDPAELHRHGTPGGTRTRSPAGKAGAQPVELRAHESAWQDSNLRFPDPKSGGMAKLPYRQRRWAGRSTTCPSAPPGWRPAAVRHALALTRWCSSTQQRGLPCTGVGTRTPNETVLETVRHDRRPPAWTDCTYAAQSPAVGLTVGRCAPALSPTCPRRGPGPAAWARSTTRQRRTGSGPVRWRRWRTSSCGGGWGVRADRATEFFLWLMAETTRPHVIGAADPQHAEPLAGHDERALSVDQARGRRR